MQACVYSTIAGAAAGIVYTRYLAYRGVARKRKLACCNSIHVVKRLKAAWKSKGQVEKIYPGRKRIDGFEITKAKKKTVAVFFP